MHGGEVGLAPAAEEQSRLQNQARTGPRAATTHDILPGFGSAQAPAVQRQGHQRQRTLGWRDEAWR